MVEWPFYVKFSLLRTGFESVIGWFECIFFYFFTVKSVYIGVTSDDVGSGIADRDRQNIWNPQKKLRIFLIRYVIGILTNKANISI